MQPNATNIGEPKKGGLVKIAVGRGTELYDLATDIGYWALSLADDLKGWIVHTYKIGISGYDVNLTDRVSIIPIASVRWTEGQEREAQVIFDQRTVYGKRLANEEYHPFSR